MLCESVTDKHEAAAVARRIIDALSEPFVVFGSEVHLTVSIGIAVATGDSATAETLLAPGRRRDVQREDRSRRRGPLLDRRVAPLTAF